MLCVFTGKRLNIQELVYGGLGNSISYKMSISASLVKNCGRRYIFSGQKYTFPGGGTHQSISNCNYVSNINLNNNKTADM